MGGQHILYLWVCALKLKNAPVQVHMRSDERLGKGTGYASFLLTEDVLSYFPCLQRVGLGGLTTMVYVIGWL